MESEDNVKRWQAEAPILESIKDERRAQFSKWGEQNHNPDKWYTILGDEFGEVGKAIYEGNF